MILRGWYTRTQTLYKCVMMIVYSYIWKMKFFISGNKFCNEVRLFSQFHLIQQQFDFGRFWSKWPRCDFGQNDRGTTKHMYLSKWLWCEYSPTTIIFTHLRQHKGCLLAVSTFQSHFTSLLLQMCGFFGWFFSFLLSFEFVPRITPSQI